MLEPVVSSTTPPGTGTWKSAIGSTTLLWTGTSRTGGMTIANAPLTYTDGKKLADVPPKSAFVVIDRTSSGVVESGSAHRITACPEWADARAGSARIASDPAAVG